ncbi:unnamed protein product, partial [Oppiella nova]
MSVNHHNDYITIFLYRFKCVEPSVVTQYCVYCLDSRNNVFIQSELKLWPPKCKLSKVSKFIRFSALVNQKHKYLPNDTLTIGLDITYNTQMIGHNKNLCLENSYNNKDLNDCRLVVGDQEFFVSEAVLSSKSKVFQKMFLYDMNDNKTNVMIIDDIKPEVFEEFLKFICFGKLDKLEEMTEQLLYVSKKYMVCGLKNICENLTIEFLDKNWTRILVTEWYNFLGNDQSLINYLKPKVSTQTMSYTYGYFESEVGSKSDTKVYDL